MQSTYDRIQYYMIDAAKKAAVINNIKVSLDRDDVKLAWLFGSITKHSTIRDVDVAIYTEAPLPFSDYLNLNAYLELKVGLPVDLVEITKVPQSLKQRILQEGLLIKGTKTLQEQLQKTIV